LAQTEAQLVFLVQAAGALLLALSLYGFFRAYRRDYLRLWTLSWLALCLALLASALSHHLVMRGAPAGARRAASLVLAVASYWQAAWLLLGLWELLRGRTLTLRRELATLGVVGAFAAAIVLGSESLSLEVRFFVRSDLRAAILSACHLSAALLISTTPTGRTAVGRKVVVAALAIYGLLQLRHPLLPLGFPGSVALDFADVFALFAVALGMVTWLLELERQRATESSAQNRQLRTLLESTPDLVAMSRESGSLVYLNAAGRRLLGVGAEEPLAHLGLCDFLDAEGSARLRGEAAEAARKQGSWQGEMVFRSRSGDEIPTLHEVVAHPDEAGGARLVSSLARDMRERRALEERLRQAQRLEAIAVLAGGVAHDFNNLLTVIGGYADLIQQLPAADPTARANAREIWLAHERGAALTRQLLAFARRQELRAEPVLVSDVVDELRSFLGRLIGPRYTLRVAGHGQERPVMADRGQLEQVITNLVVNARDAMQGGGAIELAWGPLLVEQQTVIGDTTVPAGAYMSVRVRDQGCGMDHATRLRIFEPFFTTKPAGEGTGLGLSTVYGIVEQSGGKVAVESEPGRGSTFQVLLPPAPEARRTVETVSATRLDARGSESVLVVESDEAVRRMVAHGLEGRGYRVRSAATGEEALRALEDPPERIDLLVTDVALHGAAGHELVARFRERLPDLVVLYLSSVADDPDGAGGVTRPSGGEPVLHKPFGVHDLAVKVREVLGRVATV
jgi:PAS domain S-box-containing protein